MPDPGDTGEDYYAVLGVPADASVAAIEDSYRERVKETHPDLNDAPDATDEFQRVRRAREVLTDPEERARYDRLGHERYVGNGADGDGMTGSNASDGFGGRGRRRQRARWTAEGWTDSSTGAGAGSSAGTAAGSGAGPTADPTASYAADEDAEGAGTVPPSGLGDRITVAARMLERYRFDLDPKTAIFGLATFFFYPVFLASSVTPRFPIVVNLILLCCLLCTLGYLLATPEVGVPVFGAWSLIGPIMFIFADRPLLSWAGFFLVAATFVPFGLSLTIMELLRLD
ncbi:J domain-containing protein [Haloglomus litoreum]|uniref:J domain-containing protein n=1 Tax=Haloglomus litoreum TaxID=3034026 RepID=UPI0023E80481|nr:DnaJ domain-containing protein [Haloglomus sp. DT116]